MPGVQKMLRFVSSRFGCAGARRLNTRLQSRTLSSSRVVSLPQSSGWTELTKEQLKSLLTAMDEVLTRKQSPHLTSNDSPFEDAVLGNIDACSKLFDKVGNAAYQNNIQGGSDEFRHTLSEVLRGVGNLHWMGAALSVLAFLIERYSKVKSNKSDCLKVLGILRNLAAYVFESIESVPKEKVEDMFGLISQYAAECFRLMDASGISRALCAIPNGDKLKQLHEDIRLLFGDLTLAIVIAGPRMSRTAFPDREDVVGLDDRVAEIVGYLEDHSADKEVRAIIIWGMLGVGTSTLGEKVCNRLQKQRFEWPSSYRILMKQMSKEREYPAKQEDIIRTLSRRTIKISDYKAGQEELTECFKHLKSPILLFIDDVETQEQVRHLLPDTLGKDLPPGSRVIVSTFNKRVHDVIKDEKGIDSCRLYPMEELGREQSRELFSRNAFRKPEVPHELKNKVDAVLRICGGLPLALEATGRDLRSSRDCNIIFCKKILSHQVKTLSDGDPVRGSKGDRIATLKVAYDQLGEGTSVQSTFLDISVKSMGRSWDELELLYGEDLHTLVELSLVKKEQHESAEGECQTFLKMHPLFVALGKAENRRLHHKGVRIVAENDPSPDCQRDEEGLRRLELLYADNSGLPFPEDKIEYCRNLHQLELRRVEIKQMCKFSPPKLKSFKFHCPKGRFLFPLVQMNNLIVLEVSSNPAADKDLGSILKLPPRLRKLILTRWENLEQIEKDRNVSLENVTIRESPKLRNIGGLLSLSLKKLLISGSRDIQNLARLECLLTLEELSLIDCGLKTDAFLLPPNLHSLNLSDNLELVSLPSFRHSKLKNLTLQNCPRLVEVPQDLRHLWKTSLLQQLKSKLRRDHLGLLPIRKCISEKFSRSKEESRIVQNILRLSINLSTVKGGV